MSEPADPSATEPVLGSDLTLSREVLHVGTEWTEAGRIRLRRRIVTETRTVEIAVRREELVIELYDAEHSDGVFVGTDRSGPVTDQPVYDGPLVIVLQEEVPQVGVRLQPYEKVTVTKRLVGTTGRVTGSVRREEARLDVVPSSSGDTPVR